MTTTYLDTEYLMLQVNSELPPLDDEFELWATIYLNHPRLTNLKFEIGADRHLMRFVYEQQNFNLNFEHYSESIWITPEGTAAEALLSQLQQVLHNS